MAMAHMPAPKLRPMAIRVGRSDALLHITSPSPTAPRRLSPPPPLPPLSMFALVPALVLVLSHSSFWPARMTMLCVRRPNTAAKAPMESVDVTKKETRYAVALDVSERTTPGRTPRMPLGLATPCTTPMVSDHLLRADADAAAATSCSLLVVVAAGASEVPLQTRVIGDALSSPPPLPLLPLPLPPPLRIKQRPPSNTPSPSPSSYLPSPLHLTTEASMALT